MSAEQLIHLLQEVCLENGVPAHLVAEYDLDGQLVIYTDLAEESDCLVEFNPIN